MRRRHPTKKKSNVKKAISRIGIVVAVVVIIVILAVGGYAVLSSVKSSTSTSTTSTTSVSTTSSSSVSTTSSVASTTSSSASSSAQSISTSSSTSESLATSSTSSQSTPTTFTYETTSGAEYLDPSIAYYQQDFYYLENEYENLLMYNRSTTQVLPWLASNYTISPDLKTVNFTLRSGITFDDGETVNSSAVYFSLNRLLIFDGSTPTGHGTQAAWILQQLLNTSLSSALSGPQNYSQKWVNEVLNENFVQITGPMTFTLHIQNPTSSFPQMIEFNWGEIMAPLFVMEHDVALWNQTSDGYNLPYPTLNGNLSTMTREYFYDVAATCNAGVTPKGCGQTFLSCTLNCATASLAGSGPYIIEHTDAAGDIVMQANPNYWGGPYQYMGGQKIVPYFKTIDIKVVTDVSTREIDFENAARAGQAMTIDLLPINMYDIVNRSAWLNDNVLQSVYPGITAYGPYSQFEVNWLSFDMNVTNQQTGSLYKFQPFADIRFREAFADAVNITEINSDVNNKLGIVANGVNPPGLPPTGSYNASMPLNYSFNLTAVQDLLLSAMEHPLAQFTFENGTAAPQGYFNNTFGCTTLSNSGTCTNPVPQTITVQYQSGDTFNEALYNQIASAINNVSSTYNMGLTVSLEPIPSSEYYTLAYSGYFYSYWGGYIADYPWSTDLLSVSYAPGHAYPSPDGWNLTEFQNLYNQVLKADATGNVTGNVAISNEMNALANREVMYLFTIYPEAFAVFTSNVQGVYFNPFLLYPYYFAYLS